MLYLESRCFPSEPHSEDSPACSKLAACRWSGGHACGPAGCFRLDLKIPRNTRTKSQRTLSFLIFLQDRGHRHSHCAMAKTRSLSSKSSLCSRGGPNRKCVMAARPVLRMVGWMFFYTKSVNIAWRVNPL